MITHHELIKLLRYDPLTGEFNWLVSRGRVRSGDRAGRCNSLGYITIKINKRDYGAHRLAWFYTNKEWPQHEIDHRDGVRYNNVLSNLRDVTRSVNSQNQRRAQKSNKSSGVLGVRMEESGKFIARIKVAGEETFLGSFSTSDLAKDSYIKAKRILHAGCTL